MYTTFTLSDFSLVKKEKMFSVWFSFSFIIYLLFATPQTDNIKKITKKIEK